MEARQLSLPFRSAPPIAGHEHIYSKCHKYSQIKKKKNPVFIQYISKLGTILLQKNIVLSSRKRQRAKLLGLIQHAIIAIQDAIYWGPGYFAVKLDFCPGNLGPLKIFIHIFYAKLLRPGLSVFGCCQCACTGVLPAYSCMEMCKNLQKCTSSVFICMYSSQKCSCAHSTRE